MTDREMLELAAKAAGKDNVWLHRGEHWLCWSGKPHESLDKPWNPLTDDGDALRLAVKLAIPISPETINGTTWVCRGDLQIYEPHGNEPYASTRRAITRAAAEIGRTMKEAGK